MNDLWLGCVAGWKLRLWRLLVRDVTPQQRAQLEKLLTVPEGGRNSRLDQLRSEWISYHPRTVPDLRLETPAERA